MKGDDDAGPFRASPPALPPRRVAPEASALAGLCASCIRGYG